MFTTTHQGPVADPEWLAFDDHPEWFVDLQRTPIIFTVRGLAHFGPMFRQFGVRLADVATKEQFEEHFARASMHEMESMLIQINQRAQATHQPTPYRALIEAVTGDAASMEREIKRLEHSKVAHLRVV